MARASMMLYDRAIALHADRRQEEDRTVDALVAV
jgi:hypothetical protein